MLFQDRGYLNFGYFFLSGSGQTPIFEICFNLGFQL